MRKPGKLLLCSILAATVVSAGWAHAAPNAVVGSSVKLRSTRGTYHHTGKVQLEYDMNDEEFAEALPAATGATVRIVDAGDFDVTLSLDSCVETPKKIVCTGDRGETVVKLLRRGEGAATPYRLIAKRKRLTRPKTGLNTPQAPVTVMLRVGSATTRRLTSSDCESTKPLFLQCAATFDRNAVNTAPTFTPGSNLFLDSRPPDAPPEECYYSGDVPGPQSIAGWASGFSPGPPSEAGQSLSLSTEVVSTTGTIAFDVLPTVDIHDGTLAFTLASGSHGTAQVRVTLQDDGGTAGGGLDTFESTFAITMNTPPTTSGLIASGPMGSPCILIDLMPTCSDIDGPLTGDEPQGRIGVERPTTNGALFEVEDTGILCYRPRRFFTGIDMFIFTVTDCRGGVSDPKEVYIQVLETF